MAALLLAALAFLLASFPARNTDLWQHLAAGRQLAAGHFVFGAAANPTWLYDVALFKLYSTFGGNGVVFLKALFVAAMALGLLQLSRSGPSWTIPALCAALAVLAMGTRLLLQPATVSCLMFVLCLLLERWNAQRGTSASAALVALCLMIWANLDSWFVVGLATIALYRTGRVLDQASKIGAAERNHSAVAHSARLPRLLVSLSLLALVCLLNPAHIHAFRLPPEIKDRARQVTSAFETAYFASSTGLNAAGLAYFPLLGLGLLSFAANRSRWHWQWFLPWTGLAVFSVIEVRAIPFFAIVAGPVSACNIQEYWLQHVGRRPPKPRTFAPAAWRLASATVVLWLVVIAWPGWLQAGPFEPRRWTIETAPALERGAVETRSWHQRREFGPNSRGLHLSPDSASVFAWFCPEERGLVDAGLASTILSQADGWEDQMRAARIDHVVVYDTDRSRRFTALDRFLNDPEHWPLLYFAGDLAVFGWRDPLTPDVFAGRELDLNQLAFRPAPDQRAPRQRPEREPEVRHWWHAFWKRLPPRSLDRDEATLLLTCADAMRRTAALRHRIAWDGSQYLGVVAAAGGWTVPGAFLDGHVRFRLLQAQLPEAGTDAKTVPHLDRLVLKFHQTFAWQRDDSPSALLYLTIRAARRAVAANPDDARAYLILGESYLRLTQNTRERDWAQRMPLLTDLRFAQASAALNQAVLLDPELSETHLNLAKLYEKLGYFDLMLNHQRAYFNIIKDGGPPIGISAEKFHEQMAEHQRALDRQAEAIERRLSSFAAEATRLRIYDRAVLALELGLGGKARDILLESDVAAFGNQGMALELRLMLRTGRAKEVRDWTRPEQRSRLGVNYHWLRGQALAASGDYALSREEFSRLAAGGETRALADLSNGMAGIVAESVLDPLAGGRSIPNHLWRSYRQIEARSRYALIVGEMRLQADASVLRGLIALEEGDISEAANDFRAALGIWRDAATAASGGGLDFSGRVIAQGWLASIE